MADPFRPQATVDSASRLASDISTLRSETEEIERQWPITVVRTVDPTTSDLAREGVVWIDQTSGRMFVSASPGVWVSADAQRLYAETAAQVCTTTSVWSGPNISIYVPPNGIVGFYAQADGKAGTVGPSSFAGAMLAREATDFPGTMNLIQFTDPTQFNQRTAVPGNANGTGVPYGGWIVYRATTGVRTFELGYSSAGGGANVCFQNRRLWVATF